MSTTVETARPPRSVRRARGAVAALFLTNGAIFANVVPRYPEIKDALGLSNAGFGSVVAAFSVGALLAGLLATPLLRAMGSARLATLGTLVLAAATLVVGVAPSWVVLGAALLVIGALDALVDVAQNTHGLRVQRAYGRSIVNSFHGLWAVGAVMGGLMGSTAAGLSVPLWAHLSVAAVLFSVVALVASRFVLAGPDDAERPAELVDPTLASEAPVSGPAAGGRAGAYRVLAALGLLAATGAVVEDAGTTWGSVYLRGTLGTGEAVAGLAFVSFMAAMMIGRLLGDRVVDRFGQRAVARCGGAVAAVGMALAVALPSVGMTLAGFALAGLGVATLIPAAMHAADELPGLPPGFGLMIVSWLLRVGLLVSPVVVGWVADALSLRVGLLGVVLAGLVVLIAGRVLAGRSAPHAGAPRDR